MPPTALLGLLIVTVAIEYFGLLRPVWRWRAWPLLLSLALLAAAYAGLLRTGITLWLLAIGMVALYRVIHMVRILEVPAENSFVLASARQTTGWLGLVQLILVAGLWWQPAVWQVLSGRPVVYLMGLALIALALALAASTLRQIRTTQAGHEPATTPDVKLPAVTVAIPGYTDSHQLEACLQTVLASDYPKLEVLVLDHRPQERASDDIKSLAQAGVRFLPTAQTPAGWTAKNHDYQQLYRQSSGELLLFCGVDIRFKRDSIRQLQRIYQGRRKTMIGILPLNPRQTAVPPLQALRYAWEMVPPRRLFRRPPVLSSCWLIDRQALRRAGGFDAVRRSTSPEAHFAHSAIADDGYSFFRSDAQLGISSDKPPAAQWATAVQGRYLQLHRRLELVMALALLELLVLVGPLALAAYGLGVGDGLLALLGLSGLVLHCLYFGSLQSKIFSRAGWRAYVSFVPAVAADIVLLHISMLKHEFATAD